MGKQFKTARDSLKPSPIQCTMNLLYQQALLVAHTDWNPSNSAKKTVQQSLSQNAIRQLVLLSEKSHTRLAPVLRRTICRSCRALLTCPNGMRLRFRSGKVHWQCLACSSRQTVTIGKKTIWSPSYPERFLESSSDAVLEEA
ncbi:Ribonuclease P protein subunit RPR2 [Fasciola gigantica]|uniref:Ribonuclease P protein subunit RPR2 n=1 Tax=Fasciola gigantica TaxID=46835 RepID=A0A504Z0G3_FASGI|nr:Ribonuclease P protein subunit RPR2 [Fasciola gigantica]